MIKKLLLTFLILTSALLAQNTETDLRLNHYPQALQWLKDADTNGESAYNIGVLYHKDIKDNDKAIEWYKKAYEMDDKEAAGSAANNLGYVYDDLKMYKKSEAWYRKGILKNNLNANFGLGLLYKKLHQYDEAISYYKKAYEMGDMRGANSLGYLYDVILKNEKDGIFWYKKAAKGEHAEAINNLGRTYHAKNDDVTASAYIIAMANYGYTKEEVFDFLKNDWKIDRKTLEKAYKLQQTLDIPKHYTGGID